MKSTKSRKKHSTKNKAIDQPLTAFPSSSDSIKLSSVSLQERPFRFEFEQTQSFTLMIDRVLRLGPYAIVIGWSSDTLAYQVYCDNKLYPCEIIYVLRRDVNQYLGIDSDQENGFVLLVKCGASWNGNIILKVDHQNAKFIDFFALVQNALPENMDTLAFSMGDALDVLRDDIRHNIDDWRETLEMNPHLNPRITSSSQNTPLENNLASPCVDTSFLSHGASDWDVFIDGFDGSHVFGWAKRKSSIDSQLIDIYFNGTCVGAALNADNFREDLLQAGIGNGCYGFSLSITSAAYLPCEIVEVVIHESQSGQILAQQSFDSSEFKAEYRLFIDKVDGDFINGWCVNTARFGEILELELYIDGLFYKKITTDHPRGDLKKKKISNGYGGFLTLNPLINMRPGSYTLSFALPDGSFSDESTSIATGHRRTPRIEDPTFTWYQVTIIVPIYNAPEDVSVCIARLLEYTLPTANIILIDDCSPDPAIADILSCYEGNDRITILRNNTNIGFTRTVNRGITEAGENDVILLNSDARVTPGWLQGLLIAANSAPKIATVTPMSDRAGAFSAPELGNENKLPPNVDEITFSRAFRRHSLGLYPRVPTGNGFCMYINRRCIKAIGVLDVEAFPRGYGEENDFCMRALRAGWRNIIDDRTYVFHERSKSFGTTKTKLMEEGRIVLDARYPEYKSAISVFHSDEKLLTARHCARRAWRDCAERSIPSTRILFVISTKTGGTPQTNQDLVLALPDTMEGFVLQCDAKNMEISKLENGKFHVVLRHELDDPVEPVSHLSAEYDAVVAGWLFDLDIDIVHIRHLVWQSLSLPRIARDMGKKIVYSFHDFYTLTPTVNMLDDAGVFGGDTFFATGAPERICLWPKTFSPVPTGSWLTHWRERFEQALSPCDAFVTTSENARKLLLDGLPALPPQRFFVIPHGRDFSEFSQIRQRPEHGKALRILVPGNISRTKGLDIIFALAEHDRAGLLEFHIMGEVQPKDCPIPSQIIRHGLYERKDFAQKAAAIRPHFGIVFSIWDETYCHTLTELWSVGLPVFVFDFPMVASRVRSSGAGWVVEHHDIAKLYEDILRIAFDSEAQSKVEGALTAWQTGYGMANTTRVMAAQYYAIYTKLLRGEEARINTPHPLRIAVVCPCNNDLRRGNASTHIRIWERTRNTSDRHVTYIRMTPQSLLACVKEGMIDGAVIQRTAIPLTMVPKLLQAFSTTAIPYLLDLDDDLLHVPESKDPQGRYYQYASVLKLLLEKAAVVSVSTLPLKKLYSVFNANVRLLPNFLSDRLWNTSPPPRQPDGMIRALYSGTNTHAEDLAMILPALDTVAALSLNFRLALVGIDATDHMTPARKRWLESIAVPEHVKDYNLFVPWLLKMRSRFDFAIAPLADTAFNSAKSCLKLLDYAALGLPVVASNVESYSSIDAPCLKLTDNTPAQWTQALMEQIEHITEDRLHSEEQRRWILNNYMLERTLPEFDAMIFECVGKHKSKYDFPLVNPVT